jgi:hypothetical protein
MKYQPKSEKQFAEEGLFPPGIYDVEVIEAIDRPSKAGKEMVTLKLVVFNDVGAQRTVFDYMTFGSNFGERKFRHAADCFGLIGLYETGDLSAADFQGKTGKAQIGQSKPTPQYPLPNNIIADYIGREEATVLQEKQGRKIVVADKTDLDDGIPF